MASCSKHFRKRDAILTCLRSTDLHPGADWIYEQVKQQIPDISLATVYRNLALFKEQGIIQSVGTVNGVERFDANTEPHVHFICTGCAGILDLPKMEVPTTLSDQVAHQSGCQVAGCQLTFTGLCGNCKPVTETRI